MSQYKVVYSWQSDIKGKACRHLQRKAIDNAAKAVEENLELPEGSIDVQSDTQGIPGSPPIVRTILDKIDACDVFIADLTTVNTYKKSDGTLRYAPNTNVAIEYGYALKTVGDLQIIAIMNTNYGSSKPEDLPFDIKHKRAPFQYKLSEAASKADREKVQARLSKDLTGIIQGVIEALHSTDDDWYDWGPRIPMDQDHPFKLFETEQFEIGEDPHIATEVKWPHLTPFVYARFIPKQKQRFKRSFCLELVKKIQAYNNKGSNGNYGLVKNIAINGWFDSTKTLSGFHMLERTGECWVVADLRAGSSPKRIKMLVTTLGEKLANLCKELNLPGFIAFGVNNLEGSVFHTENSFVPTKTFQNDVFIEASKVSTNDYPEKINKLSGKFIETFLDEIH